MKYMIGVLALVVLQVSITSGQRACICARNFAPVCGTDGVTYSNECRLNCVAYMRKEELSLASEGPCTTGVQIAVPCFCTDDLNEVCGSDGTTYPNSCSLNCATAKDNTLSIKHLGKCETVQVVDLPTQPPCLCLSREYAPVCGSNGQTYTNPCFLNCATVNDNTLSVKHQGACETVQASPKPGPCTCSRDLTPVCGSDGKTYNNECLLNCAKENDQTLSISHHEQCGAVNIAD